MLDNHWMLGQFHKRPLDASPINSEMSQIHQLTFPVLLQVILAQTSSTRKDRRLLQPGSESWCPVHPRRLPAAGMSVDPTLDPVFQSRPAGFESLLNGSFVVSHDA
ncbi:Protein serrate [Trichinella pseudospiralis]